MARVGFIILLATFAFVQGEVEPGVRTRIINGWSADIGEFPFLVALWLDNGIESLLQCGGSIVDEYHVITAAHCVHNFKVQDFKVYAGTTNLRNPQSIHELSDIIVHEDYNATNSWINDIALLRVAKPFQYSKTVTPVVFHRLNEFFYPGERAVVPGWGRTYPERNTWSDILQKAEIQIADQQFCRQRHYFKNFVFDSQVCAFNPYKPQGTCRGDSGGPLLINGKLVGLTSWSRGCATAINPSVYTRVSSYYDWIVHYTTKYKVICKPF